METVTLAPREGEGAEPGCLAGGLSVGRAALCPALPPGSDDASLSGVEMVSRSGHKRDQKAPLWMLEMVFEGSAGLQRELP